MRVLWLVVFDLVGQSEVLQDEAPTAGRHHTWVYFSSHSVAPTLLFFYSLPLFSLHFSFVLHKSELGQGGLLVSTWDARHMGEARDGLVDMLTAVAPDGFLMCLTHDPESVSRLRASFY